MFGIGMGPSSTEKQLQGQEVGLSQSLDQYLRTNYGEQQALLGDLTNYLNPIAAAGPNQTGYSAPELAAMNTAAINNAGGNYANAARAVGAGMSAGPGGASSEGDVTSGINAQVKGALAGQSAGQLAGTENAITQANYAQGNQNWQNAMSGLGGIAQQESPLGYISGANNANAQAFNQSNTIQQQKQAQISDIFSSALAVPSMITGFGGDIQGMMGMFGGQNTTQNNADADWNSGNFNAGNTST